MAEQSVCPESTIDSANRRNFIKNATIVAAAGIGGTMLGKSLIPESSASSASNITGCNVYSNDCVVVNTLNNNPGCTLGPGLRFGSTTSGEGISSQRLPDCLCKGYNQNGLDFYTNGQRRISIYNCGEVDVLSTLDAFCITSRNVFTCTVYGAICSAPGCNNIAVYGHSIAANCETLGCGIGVRGESTTATGVYGSSTPVCCGCLYPCGPFGGNGIGVHGSSASGIAIKGNSCNPITGVFSNNGKKADKTASIQIQNGCSTPVSWNAGVGGAGDAHGLTNGQFFVGHCGPKIVLNKCGKLGIGTIAPNATLQVNGGVSLGTRIESSNYTMGSSDFAVLVNAASKALTVILPSSSNTGQVVHIKKIDSSKHDVTIARAGTDTIEGSTSKVLAAQYNSLMLIAGGNGVWYVLSNAT
jgi:hypothetical protein